MVKLNTKTSDNQKTPSPTTTVPVTSSTLPGEIGANDVVDFGIKKSYAGGVNPNYTGLEKQTGYASSNTSTPYAYTSEDWQTLLQYSPNKIISIQQQLMKAFPGFIPGVLGDKTDPKTIKYFKLALGRINSLSVDVSSPLRGQKLDSQLTALTQMPATAMASGSTNLPSYQLSNPADLKTVFKKAAQDSLGHNLSDGDLNRLVETYQAQQLQYQKQVSAGGTTVQAPNAETFARNSIEKDFGDEVNIQKMDNIFSSIDQALSGGR
jgi:hypothetical protein